MEKLIEKEDAHIERLYRHFGSGSAAQKRRNLGIWFRISLWKGTINGSMKLKRFLDIATSLAMMILLSPFLLLTALAILIESGYPFHFSQVRIGKDGRKFKMYKFRSMYKDAEERKRKLMEAQGEESFRFKMKRDPRITRIGKWIRKLSIDELPQLVNVLMGDMSLVGPRPPVPDEVDLYKSSEMKRLHVVPGLTCIWQVSGRSDIDFKGQVKLDLEYIHRQSFKEDLKILVRTIPAVLIGRGAY